MRLLKILFLCSAVARTQGLTHARQVSTTELQPLACPRMRDPMEERVSYEATWNTFNSMTLNSFCVLRFRLHSQSSF
jgi:hypothetical protein